MPVVMRKPTLGAPSAPPPAEGASPEQASSEQTSSETAPAQRQSRAASREVPESVYAQPGADEAGDFAALFAESGSQQKQGKLRASASPPASRTWAAR